MSATDLRELADVNYPIDQVGAPIASWLISNDAYGHSSMFGPHYGSLRRCPRQQTMSTCFDPTDRLRGTRTYLTGMWPHRQKVLVEQCRVDDAVRRAAIRS